MKSVLTFKRFPVNTRFIYPILLGLILLLAGCATKETGRNATSFNGAWSFMLADSLNFKDPVYSDSHWRILDLPHDWSIEGRFDPSHPAGTGGGALPGGCAWYRKKFTLNPADSLKKVFVTFDGVYMNSQVYLNGKLLGKRPNGYLGFQYELTHFLNDGPEGNVLAVRVDNSQQPNSRWYSGSGIYRNVWLEQKEAVHIGHWGVHVQCQAGDGEGAGIRISTQVNNAGSSMAGLELHQKVLNAGGKLVAETTMPLEVPAGTHKELIQELELPKVRRWSLEEPYLYRLHSQVRQRGRILDEEVTTVGIRDFRFDPERGFLLNEKPTKIRGVCMHHDLGALGAAVHVRAMERQLEILKDMGCNAIRTAHNPPAPEWLDLCDRMGFLVMNESFDMWKLSKSEFDYALHWDQWHRRDLADHLKRDRNHPCLFSWSIGNEILEQWDSSGTAIALELASMVRELAPGLAITAGCNDPSPGNFIIGSGALDLVGYNYKHEAWEDFPKSYPGMPFVATETTSALQSRGSYDMPSDSIRNWPVRWDIPFYDGNADHSCSAYDNCCAPWGSTHEQSWSLIKKHQFLSGMFIWTGFDYLGEPTPYGWPSRSSYFGIVDLAGFPKDVYYMYQSEWTDREVLHLFPHWNWEKGQEVDVWAYTSFPEVELFVNGISQGKQRKGPEDLHLQWRCTYEPGTLKAIASGPDGRQKQVLIQTAGETSSIRLTADRARIASGGKDLSFIRMEILDNKGNPHPLAANLLQVKVMGAGSLAAVDNGHQTSHHDFQGEEIRAYHGKALAMVRSGPVTGPVTISVSSPGLKPAQLELTVE